MRIYYHLSKYLSHRLSGQDAIEALRLTGCEVKVDFTGIDDADAVIIHDEPLVYEELFTRFPRLRSLRTIAYCVWENERLAAPYIPPLRLVSEIWTPSRFSLASLLPHFPNVRLVPHVVKRLPASQEDLAYMRRVLENVIGQKRFCYLSIIDAVNPRKNLRGLLEAFALLRRDCGDAAYLVLKQYRRALDFSKLPGVLALADHLEPGRMAALHILCDAYVSAHHAEGWGLGLSQAMAYGKPVIATGYSGNMDYMTKENSFPVPYSMVPVSEEMVARVPLFTRQMRWAEVEPRVLVRSMRRLMEEGVPEGMAEKAALVCEDFGLERVGGIMRDLLLEGAR